MLRKIAIAAMAATIVGTAIAQTPNASPNLRRSQTLWEMLDENNYQCYVKIVNETDYWIDIYIDGKMVGDVEPFGIADGMFNPGHRKLYAKAPGVDYTWGPQYTKFPSTGTYTWTLTN